MAQEVYASLFANNARTLRAWRPDGGLSLRNFVGLVAEREVSSIMRSGKRCAWVEEPTEEESLRECAAGADFEEAFSSHEALRLVELRLREQLSPLGLLVFELLIVEGLDAQQVSVRVGITTAAVHMWRTRLTKHAREIASKLVREEASCRIGALRPMPGQGRVS